MDTEQKIEKAFGRKTYLPNKAKKHFPESAERELKRIELQYLLEVRKALEKSMPELKDVYDSEFDKVIRYDGISEFKNKVSDILGQIKKQVGESKISQNLGKEVGKVGRNTVKHSVAEFNTAVKRTLKFEPDDRDLNEGFFHDTVTKWTDETVGNIKKGFGEFVDSIGEKIGQAMKDGATWVAILAMISQLMKKRKRKAGMDARDAVGTMGTNAKRKIMVDYLHSDEYIWVTMKDDRVRECHASFHGKRFSWMNPPEIWYRKGGQIVFTGRHCNPGEDYGCRCIADFVFIKGKAGIRERTENV